MSPRTRKILGARLVAAVTSTGAIHIPAATGMPWWQAMAVIMLNGLAYETYFWRPE